METKEKIKELSLLITPQTERNARVVILNDFFSGAAELFSVVGISKFNATDERTVFFDKLNRNFGLFSGNYNMFEATMERNTLNNLLCENMLKLLVENETSIVVPKLLSNFPKNVIGVSDIKDKITLTFDIPVTVLNDKLVKVKVNDAVLVPFESHTNENIVEFIFKSGSFEPNSIYTVEIPSGVIKNFAGVTWVFETA